MPNHCSNTLIVKGKNLSRFIKQAEGPNVHGEVVELSFHPFIPYPEEYAEKDRGMDRFETALRERRNTLGRALTEEEVQQVRKELNFYHTTDGFNSGGYDWRVAHWGTKWDAYEVHRTVEGDTVVYHFLTAWAPPVPVVAAMAEQYPTLRFELNYEEPGMAFAGKEIYENGELVFSKEWELYSDQEEEEEAV